MEATQVLIHLATLSTTAGLTKTVEIRTMMRQRVRLCMLDWAERETHTQHYIQYTTGWNDGGTSASLLSSYAAVRHPVIYIYSSDYFRRQHIKGALCSACMA
jgi:hypothetical protein